MLISIPVNGPTYTNHIRSGRFVTVAVNSGGLAVVQITDAESHTTSTTIYSGSSGSFGPYLKDARYQVDLLNASCTIMDALAATTDLASELGVGSSSSSTTPNAPIPLPSGTWTSVPSISRLALSGTGTVTIDAKNLAGSITSSVVSYTVSGATNQIKFPFYGSDTVQICATYTGSASAEVI